MLPTALSRFKVRHGEVTFRWLSEQKKHDLERAARLVEIVQGHVGGTRRDLEEALRVETDAGRDYRIRRGMGHLLTERTTFETSTKLVPSDVRKFVFTEAAKIHPVNREQRTEVLQKGCEYFNVDQEGLEKALYADLAQNQEITDTPKMTPVQLVHRYNVALVQSALLRCHHLQVRLENPGAKRLRQLYRYLKFFRLLYRVDSDESGITIIVDGPASVVHQSTRYGVLLAKFFPALLLCERWSMEALVQAKKRSPRGLLRLTHELGLRSHYPDTGTWIADEERALIQRLIELGAPLTVSTEGAPISLSDQQVFVPDFVITDPQTQKTVAVEVLWRWRRRSLASRAKELKQLGNRNVILLLCSAGQSDEQIPASVRDKVISFVQIPNARSILKRARTILGQN